MAYTHVKIASRQNNRNLLFRTLTQIRKKKKNSAGSRRGAPRVRPPSNTEGKQLRVEWAALSLSHSPTRSLTLALVLHPPRDPISNALQAISLYPFVPPSPLLSFLSINFFFFPTRKISSSLPCTFSIPCQVYPTCRQTGGTRFIHTRMHTKIGLCIYSHTQILHAFKDTCTRTHSHSHAHTHRYMHTYIRVLTFMYACSHSLFINVKIYTSMQLNVKYT